MGEHTIEPAQLTRLLEDWNSGDAKAIDNIMGLLYDDLKHMAEMRFSQERVNHTLQPTALVNEVYLRLTNQRLDNLTWENRTHFLKMVSIMMRRILIDSARRHNAAKKGNDQKIATPTGGLEQFKDQGMSADQMINLDLALNKLEAMDPLQSKIVHLKFFMGFTNQEVADLLQIGERTVRREWNVARAWLSRELEPPRA